MSSSLLLTITASLLSFLLGVNTVLGQSKKWEWISPSTNGNILNGINITDDGKITLAYNKTALISEDLGALWTTFTSAHPLAEVILVSESLDFTLTMDGRIMKGVLKNDEREVFHKVGKNARFTDLILNEITGIGLASGGYEVWEPNDVGGYAINNWGFVVRTTDFGETWQIVYENEGDKLKGLINNGDYGYLAYGTERFNFVVRSFDGINWSFDENFGLGEFVINGLEFINDSIGYLSYESHPNLYYTKNGGVNWQLKEDFDVALYGLTASKDVVVVRNHNTLFISYDQGLTWIEKASPSDRTSIWDIENSGDLIYVQVGPALFVSKSLVPEFVPLNSYNLESDEGSYDIDYINYNRGVFTSESVGYVPVNSWSRNASRLLKTVDGGCTWEPKPNYPGYWSTSKLYFINDQSGFAIAGNLYKTSDGGNTWVACTAGRDFSDLAFFTDQIGIAISTYGEIWRSTDGGLNWIEVRRATTPRAISILNGTTAFISVGNDQILKSTDGGATWSLIITGFKLPWYGIHFFDFQNGLAAGNYDFYENEQWVTKRLLVRTSDGGGSWTKVMDLPESPSIMKFFNSQEGYILGENGLYLKTLDGGNSWVREETINQQRLHNIFSYNGTQYVFGDYWSIIKLSELATAKFEISDQIFCQGDSISATNKSLQANSFVWKLDNVVLSKETNLKSIVNASPGVHDLQLASGGCSMTNYNIETKSITILARPMKPTILVNEKPVINNHRVLCDSLYAASTQSNYSYQWSTGAVTQTLPIGNESQLYVKVGTEQGCFTVSDTVTISRKEKPMADFGIQFSDNEITFITLAEDDSVVWEVSNGLSSTQPVFTIPLPDFAQLLTVTLRVSNFCGEDIMTKTVTISEVVGSKNNVFHFHPNPIAGGSNLTINDLEIYSVSLISLYGQEVITDALVGVDGTILIPKLECGIYLLISHGRNGKQKVGRLLIE